MKIHRRQVLKSAAAVALGGAFSAVPGRVRAAKMLTASDSAGLTAKAGSHEISRDGKPLTLPFWGYDGATPGRVLRLDQGATLDLVLNNELPEETSIHWHGIRTPNAMDGVPHLTQPPVGVGDEFRYRFACEDAGTYWYHPHANSAEQVGRGLYGALIVNEAEPVAVDRDLVWMLADWLVRRDGAVSQEYASMGQNSHAGRMGNLVTVNGSAQPGIDVQPGERIRLRLVNAAAARVFSLDFSGLGGWWVALDGHPIKPRPIAPAPVFIPPGGRADVVLDVPPDAKPGTLFEVIDATYRGQRIEVARFKAQGKAVRAKALAAPTKMADNPLPRPDLDGAEMKTVRFEGGAMGGMAGAKLDGVEMPIGEMARQGVVWATNGQAWSSLAQIAAQDRLLNFDLGKSYVLRLQNRSAFLHPIHMHGHTFQVIAVNGKKQPLPEWRDTVLVFPNEHVDIAFVADNPGDWLIHCHVLGHATAGMIAAFAVA